MGLGDLLGKATDFGQAANRGMYGRDINGFGDLRGAVYGDQSDPGMLGQGYRKPGEVGVDRSLAGLPNYQTDRNGALANALGAQQRAAGTMGAASIDQSQQAQFRNGQGALADMLMRQAQGQGPSLAQQQLQAGTDRNMAQAMAMAQAQQGQGAGLAQRQVAQQQAGLAAQAAQDSGALRLQEQMQAQNQLAQVLAGARGQDIGLATEQANLNQGAGSANLQALLAQRGLNDAQDRFFSQSAYDLSGRQGAQNMALMQLLQQNGFGNQQLQQNAYDAAAQRRAGMVPGMVQSAGNVASSAGSALMMGAL